MRAALETPGRELIPDLNAAFVLENDRPEWAFLKGERLYMGQLILAAVALEFGQVRVRNPFRSGMISIISFMQASDHSGAGRVEIRRGCTLGAQTAGLITPRDGRYGQLQVATIIEGETAPALTGTVTFISHIPLANTIAPIPVPIVLAPGHDIFVVNPSVNATTAVSIVGYERALETYEDE